MTLEEKEQAMDAISAINEFLANSNCEDFMIKYYNGEKLCLIGSFDLCYYSKMEILFEQVSYISMYTYFSLWKLKLLANRETYFSIVERLKVKK